MDDRDPAVAAAPPAARRLFETPAGVALGPLAAVADGGARGYVLQLRAGRFHGFVVRRGAAVWGWVDRCPHAGVALPARLDDYLTPGGELIACSWHGALFEVDSGRGVGGPCVGQRLTPWPVRIEGDMLVTGPALAAAPD